MERNGPNGMANLRFFPFSSITVIPTKVPASDEAKMVKITPFQPIKVPIIPKSLMSPPPMPSLRVMRLYVHATIKRLPPPTSKPSREDLNVMAGKTKEAARPMGIPGSEIISGMIL